MKTTKIEVCIESVESAVIAQDCGADRVEVCSALSEGGITPSLGLVHRIREKLNIGVHVIIRPRRGDFCYSDDEFACMKNDVKFFREIGVDGFVFGILTKDGEIDCQRCREIIECAGKVSITFHRAFDAVKDPFKALEDCISLGIDRILTSGLRQKAEEGIPMLKQLTERAKGRIIILAGSGINENNIEKIIRETGVKEIHLSAKERLQSVMEYRKEEIPMSNSSPISEYELERTSSTLLINAIKKTF